MESTGGGECEIADRYVNPLSLKAREEAANLMTANLSQDLSLKRSNKSHSFAMEYRDKASSFSSNDKKSSSEENILNRVRRDRSMIIRAEKLIDKDGKKTNIVSMVKPFAYK